MSGVLPLALVRSWITGNRAVSLPFSQYGGPLTNDMEALECVLRHLREYLYHGYQYVRLRTRDPFDPKFAVPNWLRASEYYSRCVIPLENRSERDVWSRLHANSVRWAVRRSLRSGVVVNICEQNNDVRRFRELMLQTCKKHGVPPYSIRLLEGIDEVLAPKKLARIFVAKLNEKIIAILILFTINEEATFAYNFSDVNYLRLYPNNALIWSAIKWSLDNGFRNFDMGISSPQDNQLLSFKMRWGPIVSKLREYFIASNENAISPDRRACKKYKSATLVWRFLLPSFVASVIGPRILPHFE